MSRIAVNALLSEPLPNAKINQSTTPTICSGRIQIELKRRHRGKQGCDASCVVCGLYHNDKINPIPSIRKEQQAEGHQPQPNFDAEDSEESVFQCVPSGIVTTIVQLQNRTQFPAELYMRKRVGTQFPAELYKRKRVDVPGPQLVQH